MFKKLMLISLMTVAGTACLAQPFNQPRLDSLFQVLEKNDKFMGSIAVSQGGKLLYTHTSGYRDVAGAQRAAAGTRYRIGSISKMFTAVLVLKAIEEKRLSLSQTLSKYYPTIVHSDQITIGQLLSHRSGIHNFTDDVAYLSYHTQAKSEQELLAIIVNGKSDFAPDSKAAYSNANYVLLSYILEKVYQASYGDILRKQITQPLGLADTYFGGKTDLQKGECYSYRFDGKWQQEAETDMSIPIGAGGLVSTPADLVKFIEQLFAGKLITEKSLALMTTTRDRFGMGMFELPYPGHNSYGHTGGIDGFQSMLRYFPKERLAVAVISNGAVYSVNNVQLCALSGFFHQPFALPVYKTIVFQPAELDVFTGVYASTDIPVKITITRQELQLTAQATGQPSFPLEAVAQQVFQFEKAGVVMEFDAEKRQLLLKQGGKAFLFTKE